MFLRVLRVLRAFVVNVIGEWRGWEVARRVHVVDLDGVERVLGGH
jgi:hypothetical protein